MINITAFSQEVRDRREEALALIGTNPYIQTYRDALRIVCDEGVWMIYEEKTPVYTAETLRAELGAASTAAYLDGATRKQIDLIVALCSRKNDFSPIGCSRFTKDAASRLIDDLKREG